MIAITYITDTIAILENSSQDEALIDEDDYQNIALRILKCDSYLMDSPGLKDRVKFDWFEELTGLFYDKMWRDIGELEDED